MGSRLLALLLFAACASGLKLMAPAPRSAAMCTRRAVPLVAAGLAFASRAPAFAEDGKKNDKKFISCVSECVYQEQKIAKGIAEVEYVTQKEAIAKRTPVLTRTQHPRASVLLVRGTRTGLLRAARTGGTGQLAPAGPHTARRTSLGRHRQAQHHARSCVPPWLAGPQLGSCGHASSGARLVALGSSALPGRGPATGAPATDAQLLERAASKVAHSTALDPSPGASRSAPSPQSSCSRVSLRITRTLTLTLTLTLALTRTRTRTRQA